MNKTIAKYDVVIIGGGPAGLTAAIYAVRRNLRALVITAAVGGQAAQTNHIENWPGDKVIDGFELMNNMLEQAKGLSVEFAYDTVSMIEKSGEAFLVKTLSGNYEALTVILAFGLTPRELEVPGEKEFRGRGVSYCAICDGPLFKKKKVAVIGSGNSAMEAAEYLAGLAEKVYVVNRSDKFKGEAGLPAGSPELARLQVEWNQQVKEIIGKDKVEKIVLHHRLTGEDKTLEVDGVFVEIGHIARTQWLEGLVKLNDRMEIITDKNAQTSAEGIYAAGDCTDVDFKQIVIAAGEGSKAGLSAYKYISAKKGGVARHDWGVFRG